MDEESLKNFNNKLGRHMVLPSPIGVPANGDFLCGRKIQIIVERLMIYVGQYASNRDVAYSFPSTTPPNGRHCFSAILDRAKKLKTKKKKRTKLYGRTFLLH
jgi:hypothetical protein